MDLSPTSLQWWYLGSGGIQMGPFAAHHLHQFLLSGVCQRDLSVCHGPSSVWLPLWLVLQLVGLQEPPQQQQQQQPPAEHPVAQQAPAQHTSNAGRPAQRQQQGRPSATAGGAAVAAGSTTPPRPAPSRAGSKVSAAAAAATHKLDDEEEESDDYGYGVSSDWLKKVKAVEAATKARQQQERQQQQQQQPPAASKPSVHKSQQQSQQQALQEDHSADADMQDASAKAMLDAVSQLRGEQEYLDELHRAVAMDWEPTAAAVSGTASQQQQQVSAGGAGGGTCSAVDLAQLASGVAAAAASSSGATLPQQQQQGDSSVLRLVLVLDTNVLLEKQLLQFLSKLHSLQGTQQHQHQHNGVAGCVRWQLPQAASAAAVGVGLRVVIPWTVLVELDKLKLSEWRLLLHADMCCW